MKFEWKVIDGSEVSMTKRAQIIGGWVLLNNFYDTDCHGTTRQSESMVFIPDPKHEWLID